MRQIDKARSRGIRRELRYRLMHNLLHPSDNRRLAELFGVEQAHVSRTKYEEIDKLVKEGWTYDGVRMYEQGVRKEAVVPRRKRQREDLS